jgi:2-hydroxy-3-keto-5-methylthiopentenyl-1-phosphate phosphatase
VSDVPSLYLQSLARDPKSRTTDAFGSHFGHDKSIEIRQYAKLPDAERPTMFYAGDGVSDLSAAKETDLLFAKKGHGKRHSPVAPE